MSTADTARVADAVWRMESARIIGALARNVGLAEELAQDAMVEALEHWPTAGVPDNPGASLMAVAKNRAFDYLRHTKLQHAKEGELTYAIETALQDAAPDLDALIGDDIGDDLLRLMFVACHPTKLRVPSWSVNRPWRSVLCAPSARWARRGSHSRCRAPTSWRRAWRRYCR